MKMKTWQKITLGLLVIAAAAALLTSRFFNNEPDMEDPFPLLELFTFDEHFTINWGFNIRPGISLLGAADLDSNPIVTELNGRFNVTLKTQPLVLAHNESGFIDAARAEEPFMKLIDDNNLPDVFRLETWMDYHVLLDSGLVRPVPWDMVERYAPNYAALLSRDLNFFERMKHNYADADGNFYLLLSLTEHQEMLTGYSIYRLDWLEELGIAPPGEVVKLMDGLYFTEAAYTIDEFTNIMQGFAGMQGTGQRHGLSMNMHIFSDLFFTQTMLGMFGVHNQGNINENGSTQQWFASEGYKQYLLLLTELIEMGAVYFPPGGSGGYSCFPQQRVGWQYRHINTLFGEHDVFKFLRRVNPDAKILITPPEIGPMGIQTGSGDQNMMTHGGTARAGAGASMMVNASVPDDKLARILQIYNGIAFHPELWLLLYHGIEGEDFAWEGEPFESAIIKNAATDHIAPAVRLLSTYIWDQNIIRLANVLSGNPTIIHDFATSEAARQMIGRNYKNTANLPLDGLIMFDEKRAAWNEKYEFMELIRIANEFLADIISKEKDVLSWWDHYIENLNHFGLAAYNEIFDALP